MSHKSSTALRYTGTGADFAGFHARASHRCMPTLQGVDPASSANLHETRTSTRSPFARDEFCETCELVCRLLNLSPQRTQRGKSAKGSILDPRGFFVVTKEEAMPLLRPPSWIGILADSFLVWVYLHMESWIGFRMGPSVPSGQCIFSGSGSLTEFFAVA